MSFYFKIPVSIHNIFPSAATDIDCLAHRLLRAVMMLSRALKVGKWRFQKPLIQCISTSLRGQRYQINYRPLQNLVWLVVTRAAWRLSAWGSCHRWWSSDTAWLERSRCWCFCRHSKCWKRCRRRSVTSPPHLGHECCRSDEQSLVHEGRDNVLLCCGRGQCWGGSNCSQWSSAISSGLQKISASRVRWLCSELPDSACWWTSSGQIVLSQWQVDCTRPAT